MREIKMAKKLIGKANSKDHKMELLVEAGLYSIDFDGILALSPTTIKIAKRKWKEYLVNYGMIEAERTTGVTFEPPKP